ncbi:hypothetical protein ACFYY8_22560 [Streptosporangium sp. NPDC001559]|uniref:hypothetical protein n=1 Tax=Streptosporangium sp. NPDC001559 TaxID=3366187 RepID=UPI0036E3CD82
MRRIVIGFTAAAVVVIGMLTTTATASAAVFTSPPGDRDALIVQLARSGPCVRASVEDGSAGVLSSC